tara:strand:- start:36260 stop:36448 length:189 start_codon:yes stop_codon:yes gene_type:complete
MVEIDKMTEDVASFEELLNLKLWEPIPDEDLHEDGELDDIGVRNKVLHHLFQTGEYTLIRRK